MNHQEEIDKLEKELRSAYAALVRNRWDKGLGDEARYNQTYLKLYLRGARRNRLRKKYCAQ